MKLADILPDAVRVRFASASFLLLLCRVFVMSSHTNVVRVWAWMPSSPSALGTRAMLWFGHGCCRPRRLLVHERYCGLGVDAVFTLCSWCTNVIMVWAWMLSPTYALGTRTLHGSGISAESVHSQQPKNTKNPIRCCSSWSEQPDSHKTALSNLKDRHP